MANLQSGFNTTSFEQFVRVLSIQVFGPGVTVFGNGPDGGREATFNGAVNYPHPPTQLWNGYGVIQAKFKEKFETTKVDQDWAIEQLTQELEQFRTSEKRKPKPEYYVFVTNVDLTSASNGGKDRVNKLVRKYSCILGIKNHAVWDGNQIKGYLDTYPDLRKTYFQYLTSGDLISELIKYFHINEPNAEAILHSFLDREITADEYARLDQAGNRSDYNLSLSNVFFDLPGSETPQVDPPEEIPDENGRLQTGILNELLIAGSCKKDLKTISELKKNGDHTLAKNRFMIFGGPGSGKSTIAQFLAQIHRAAYLERRSDQLQPETLKAVGQIRKQCTLQGLLWPSTPRIPLRIDLNHFGKALSRKDGLGATTLEDYLIKNIRQHWELTYNDFHKWLPVFSWLMILDGLDEVPVTSNRDSVMRAIRSFVSDMNLANADLVIVATTRTQGYQEEFQSDETSNRYVLPLSKARSLKYVEQYAIARYGKTDPKKMENVIAKLNDESTNGTTRDLLTSPLQVTFIVIVVASGGELSNNRWKLFNDYYEVVYKREQQKAVPPFDSILSEYKHIIDDLHQNVGFLLQYRGEVSSNQGVSVETSELMSLIDVHLQNAGFEGVEKDELVSRIVGITNQRLVFLTNKNDNEWSFEVRSLQEYMAAERLLSRADAQIIEDRLRSIALSSYWRNVFLFAVGKSFNQVDRLDLCDKIFSICFDLGSTDTKEIIYSWHGQELALEILMSGAVNTNPNFTKKFYSISLGLLDLPNPESMVSEFFNILGSDKIDRIVSLSSKQQCSQIVLTKIRSRLESDDPKSISIASWEILVSLVHLNIGEAIELANRKWPTDAESQFLILRFFPMFKETQWLKRKLQEFIPHAKIKHINYFQNSGFVLVVDDSFPARELFRKRSPRPETKIKIVGQATNYISYTSLGAESTRKVVASIKGLGSVSCELDIYNVAASFISEPNRQSLCDILNFAADNDLFGLRFQLPWVVHDCIRHATSSLDLRSFADIARDGGFGDQEQWLQAERRWDSNGIAIDDLFYATEGDMPYDRNIGSIGFPRYHNLHAEWKGMINFPFAVVDILPRITDRRNRSVAFNWLMFLAVF